MTKRLLTSVALSALTLIVTASNAAASTPGKMMERAENRDERQEVRQENRDERQENRQENRQERRDQVLEKIATRVEERFSRHQARLQNWIDRASKNITEKETKGKDVGAAKTALATATTSLTTATKLGNDAVTLLKAVTAENWTAQKADAIAAREAVKKAQVAYAQVAKDLQQVVVSLKNLK